MRGVVVRGVVVRGVSSDMCEEWCGEGMRNEVVWDRCGEESEVVSVQSDVVKGVGVSCEE